MVAYTKPQQRKKEESKRLRGERDKIKFIDLRFEKWQVVRFRKARRSSITFLFSLKSGLGGHYRALRQDPSINPSSAITSIKLITVVFMAGFSSYRHLFSS